MTVRLSTYICLLSAIVLSAGAVMAGEFQFHYQKIVTVPEPAVLNLNALEGNITIVGNWEDRIIIEAVKKIRADSEDEAEEIADHIEIRVDAVDSEVTLDTRLLKMFRRSRSFWSRLFGTGGRDSFGSVDYRISVPNQTSLKIMAMEGDIAISEIEGRVDIDNTAGSVYAEYVFGPVTVLQPDGLIDLRWVEGDIRVKSTRATVNVVQVRGALDLDSRAGDVTIKTELDSPRDYYVETSSGSITFLIPALASGVLDLSTSAGEIRTEVAVAIKEVTRKRLVGEFGGGGPKIVLTSSTGDVEVSQY